MDRYDVGQLSRHAVRQLLLIAKDHQIRHTRSQDGGFLHTLQPAFAGSTPRSISWSGTVTASGMTSDVVMVVIRSSTVGRPLR